jgi:fluoride ion exporter CrcB/FEX
MRSRSFFILIFLFSVLLAVFHFIGAQFELYLDLWWFDIAMHTLGGAISGGFTFIVARWFRPLAPVLERVVGTYVIAIVGALLIGLSWELFEKYYDLVYTQNYIFDTTLDLIMDVVGAILIGRYALRKGFVGRGESWKKII